MFAFITQRNLSTEDIVLRPINKLPRGFDNIAVPVGASGGIISKHKHLERDRAQLLWRHRIGVIEHCQTLIPVMINPKYISLNSWSLYLLLSGMNYNLNHSSSKVECSGFLQTLHGIIWPHFMEGPFFKSLTKLTTMTLIMYFCPLLFYMYSTSCFTLCRIQKKFPLTKIH